MALGEGGLCGGHCETGRKQAAHMIGEGAFDRLGRLQAAVPQHHRQLGPGLGRRRLDLLLLRASEQPVANQRLVELRLDDVRAGEDDLSSADAEDTLQLGVGHGENAAGQRLGGQQPRRIVLGCDGAAHAQPASRTQAPQRRQTAA